MNPISSTSTNQYIKERGHPKPLSFVLEILALTFINSPKIPSVSQDFIDKRCQLILPYLHQFVLKKELKGDLAPTLESYLKKKGCCHGFCIAFIKKGTSDDVLYFQLLECLRGEEILDLLPAPQKREIFNFKKIKKIQKALSEDGTKIVRIWNKTGHSLVYQKSNLLFFNPSYGVVTFKNEKALFRGFITNVYAIFLCKKGGMCAIETY